MDRKITTFMSIVLSHFKAFVCLSIYLILQIILGSHVAIITMFVEKQTVKVYECCIPGSGLRASHTHLINYDNVPGTGTVIIPCLKKKERERERESER